MTLILILILAMAVGWSFLIQRRLRRDQTITHYLLMRHLKLDHKPKTTLPIFTEISGLEWKCCIMLVHSRHKDGSPRLVSYLKDDAEIDLAGGEEFQVMYGPTEDMEPNERRSA